VGREEGVREMRWVVKKKRGLVGVVAALALLMLLASDVVASPVVFDFNALQNGDTDLEISTYMTDVLGLGMPVITVNAVAGSGGFGEGTYLMNTGGDLEIYFESRLKSASFEFVLFDGGSFTFTPYVQGVPLTQIVLPGLPAMFPLTLNFNFLGEHVDRLIFSSSSTIGIDNLAVIPNPEPSTLLLMGGGLMGLGWIVRRRRRA
jgi:hypothetical protein